MQITDRIQFNWRVLQRHRVRTLLLLTTIAVGVASVIMLTSIGEGARRYVDREFTSLGNQLLIILPGRNETSGGAPPIYGTTPRDLTLEDAQALRVIPTVRLIAPIIAGTAQVKRGSVAREVMTIGSNADLFPVRKLDLSMGQALPAVTANRALPVCVLGAKLKRELFGNTNPINQWVRIGERRFRVIGTLRERGESLGLDLRDMVIIPVRSAEMLFNSPGLFRILLELQSPDVAEYTKQRIRKVISRRHEGEDDITLISQDSMLSTFDNILTTLTASLGAIAGLSLIVAGILIMNISLISVSQRRAEIGLLKAIGASGTQVRQLFLDEALMLSALGALLGLILGEGVIAITVRLLPEFPLAAPLWADLAAIATAILCGVIFAWWPASRAARLDPVRALRGDI